MKPSNIGVAHLSLVWLGLLGLTAVSLALGRALHGQAGLQLLVAGILWLKAWLVARDFILANECHPFIRRVVYGFIAITPVCISLLGFWGKPFARWASL